MISELALLYTRDLDKVMAEIAAYPDEDALWKVTGQIANPAGNLALHLVGNLSQFVGDDLGDVPFARDRDSEFARKDVPRAELLSELKRTRELVEQTLARLDGSRLDRPHPRQPPGFPEGMTSRYFLIHLYGHLNYHLGQINYHRRLLALQP
ncbi:DinB family protein [Deinococcus altitudinis]|uniref:DinB family protein n=1 Tax=Deinococcus altitudinis TaxID=468914 RepID=UPI0038911BAD